MENHESSEMSFWEKYAILHDNIHALRKKTSVDSDFYRICTDIEEKILEHEEESYLSPLQNKVRILISGSDLFKEICITQRYLTSLEMKRAVGSILQEEKYSEIARRISSRKQLEIKREKFFFKKALSTIKDFLDETGETEQQTNETQCEVVSHDNNRPGVEITSSESMEKRTNNQTFITTDILQPETFRNVPEKEDFRVSNMNIIYDENMPAHITNPQWDVTVPTIHEEKSCKERETNADLVNVYNILEGGVMELSEISDPMQGDIGITAQAINNTQELDGIGELLPVSSPPIRKRKKYQPMSDPTITINNYAERAMRLNKKIVVQRVQVFEGPPTLMRAFTLDHVLETPAVNSGFSGAVRSPVLENLYRRHQRTQRRAHIEVENSFMLRRLAVQKHLKDHEDEVQVKQRASLEPFKSPLLEISITQKSVLQNGTEMVCATVDSTQANVERSTSKDIPMEALFERGYGTPVSKILEKEVLAPEMGAYDPQFLPRIQNVNGKQIEEPLDEPCFRTVQQRAPSEKWREFKFVRDCLIEIWNFKKENGLEMGATLREILELKGDWSKENALTLLRIVDKMSLRREILLKGSGTGILIHPFQVPYVTPNQYKHGRGFTY